jgi:hypothetical protein
MPIRAVPMAMKMAQIRLEPRLPALSITRLATRLPARPPIVKMAVRREKVTSDIGMHPERRGVAAKEGGIVVTLHVRTAWIWFNTEMW